MKILMDKDKLKLIVRNMELLVDSLKSEVYSDPEAYTSKVGALPDGCYSIDDDDGYPD